MNIAFDGIGQVCATFLGSNITEGQMVKLSAPGSVGPCADGDCFCGLALCSRDDACTVQVGGFMTAPYSNTAPSVGRAVLCADGKGGVKSASSGVTCLVVDSNPTDKTVTFML